ncbi:SE1832 family protein [Metabacillus litoralis]|uniref:SE1832 family protein n=2 Tax=Metabacillus litoralis TaxID=152268 RepID=UPI002040B187|nr:SE1832 family protein [Metabacillus litoralis]MCM3159988.1 hypothetical protein [Metabacillus litoralis]
MSSQDIQQKIEELKMEYIRVQGDIEKLEATGHSIEKLESKLLELEEELSKYRSQLKKIVN